MKIPKDLKQPGRTFWKEIQTIYDMTEPHDTARLRMACRCLDEVQESEDIIAKEGRFVTDRFDKIIEHSAGKVIRDAKILFCRIIRELALDLTTTGDSRPPRIY